MASGSANKEELLPTWGYATRKTIAEGALDLALLMSNAAQLKAVVDSGKGTYYVAELVLLSVSIALQVVVGVLLVILGMKSPTDEAGRKKAENMNNASVGLIFVITVINIFISAFGISYNEN